MPEETGGSTDQSPLARLQALKDEHRQLDDRISALSGRPYLSTEDQIEVGRLKKLKLRKKEEIYRSAREIGVDH